MIYACCDERRLDALRDNPTFPDGTPTPNGIDFLEVLDHDAPPDSPRQQTLLVRCLKALPALDGANVRIEGGTRVTPVRVVWAAPASAPPPDLKPDELALLQALPAPERVLVVRTDSAGDFSTYRLRLVRSPGHDDTPDGFDPLLSVVDFSFKVECPSDFDCRVEAACPPEPAAEPNLDYLAKDYASFRQLMLDRLAVLLPGWRERNPADLGVTLVELLAYVGDRLSYRQDAVATEAYLGTARRRVSVRRHARLVDYAMHDGCNARAWVQVLLNAETVAPQTPVPLRRADPATGLRIRFLTRCGPDPLVDPRQLGDVLARQAPEVFEPLHDAALYPAHARLPFYTWGDRECCLPRGAISATLRGRFPNLQAGDVLLFEEVLGPRTGQAADADPSHRHAVRLVSVALGQDALGGLLDGAAEAGPVDVTEIAWHPEDALPFPLCLSARTDDEHGGLFVDEVSVARGNVVLVDHGRTLDQPEPLPAVPGPSLFRALPPSGDPCQPAAETPIPPRYRPRLAEAPLTQAAPLDGVDPTSGRAPGASAAAAFRWDLAAVRPVVSLNGGEWQPRRDLLASDRLARDFVAEVEDDGRATLRFGDGQHGARPAPGTAFAADYRIGNGARGNVAAEAVFHAALAQPSVPDRTDPARPAERPILGVRNPLPASGGQEPESVEHVRQNAPFAFRVQERAVTADDYAEVAARHPGVQQAAATFRWTGSWLTVFLTVDRLGGLPLDDDFRVDLARFVGRFRLAGYDLEIDGPRYVSLELALRVCVQPNYFRADVERALGELFSNRTLPDGRRGLFDPDNFTFGQPVYLSRLYAAAQAVAGVASVEAVTLQRQGTPSRQALDSGKLALGRLEIARLDNDPNFPEHGVFRLTLEGGK